MGGGRGVGRVGGTKCRREDARDGGRGPGRCHAVGEVGVVEDEDVAGGADAEGEGAGREFARAGGAEVGGVAWVGSGGLVVVDVPGGGVGMLWLDMGDGMAL